MFRKAFFNESFVAMPGAPPHDGDPQDQHSLRNEDVAKKSGIHEGNIHDQRGNLSAIFMGFHDGIFMGY